MAESIKLNVLMHGHFAGVLTHDKQARTGLRVLFEYDAKYLARPDATPLSVSVPLRQGATDICWWLDGLLPDNYGVLQQWRMLYNTAGMSAMDFLALPLGRDCAGAVQFFCEPDKTDKPCNKQNSTKRLTENDIAETIQMLTQYHTVALPRHKPGFVLSGAQPKTALHYDNGQWLAPCADYPTTHILKPPVSGFPDQHIIEHLSQRTARLLGLRSAETVCVNVKDQQAVLVTRHDRKRSENGTYELVHQEDMCQALGLAPANKYERMGGPGIKEIAALLWLLSSKPEQDVRMFRDALIYNWLIVGSDAHAKNYGLLLNGKDVRLAPLYDLCSMLPYHQVTRRRDLERRERPVEESRLAMKIGSDHTIGASDCLEAWQDAAHALALPEEETVSRAVGMAEQLPTALQSAISELPRRESRSPHVEVLRQQIIKRSELCQHLRMMSRGSNQRASDVRSETPDSPQVTHDRSRDLTISARHFD